MFQLNEKFAADLLLYLLSHFECDGHIVHMLTQQRLLPPRTKYSEIVIVHTCAFQSTLLGCRVTSILCKLFLLHYSDWIFYGQTSYIFSYLTGPKGQAEEKGSSFAAGEALAQSHKHVLSVDYVSGIV